MRCSLMKCRLIRVVAARSLKDSTPLISRSLHFCYLQKNSSSKMHTGKLSFILRLNVLLLSNNLLIAPRKLTPLSVRSILFDDGIKGKRFEYAGSLLATKSISNQFECALLCNIRATCRSFNVCGKLNCQLNIEDFFSTEAKTSALSDDETCDYFGMKKDQFPICEAKGENVPVGNSRDQPNLIFRFFI